MPVGNRVKPRSVQFEELGMFRVIVLLYAGLPLKLCDFQGQIEVLRIFLERTFSGEGVMLIKIKNDLQMN